jgi:hypothetical protein
MEEHQNPEEVAKSGQKHLEFATGDLKEAASATIENIRQAAGQKADEHRGAAQGCSVARYYSRKFSHVNCDGSSGTESWI